MGALARHLVMATYPSTTFTWNSGFARGRLGSLPVLRAMGAGVHHVGAWGDGALAKLATNAMLGIQVTGLAEIIGLLKRKGADVPGVLAAMAGTSVLAPIANYLSSTMAVAAGLSPIRSISLIRCARPRGVIEAFLWMFIRGVLKEVGRLENLHLLSPRVNNLLGNYT